MDPTVGSGELTPEAAPSQPPNGSSRSPVRMLGIVVVVQTVALVALAVMFAFVSLRQQARFEDAMKETNERYEDYFGISDEMMPTPEEMDMYSKAEEVGYEVGYLMEDKDLEGYLALYRADDDSVDMEAVEEAFAKAVDRAGDMRLDYWPEPMSIYEDENSGETLARVTLYGESMTSDASTGVRITVWVLTSDSGNVLTGNRGRDLKSLGSPYF